MTEHARKVRSAPFGKDDEVMICGSFGRWWRVALKSAVLLPIVKFDLLTAGRRRRVVMSGSAQR